MSGLTGVMLMSFGTPASPDEVPEFLERIRPMAPEVVAEMQRRYRLIGGSPLTRITREQAAALEAHLNNHRRSCEGRNLNAPTPVRGEALEPHPPRRSYESRNLASTPVRGEALEPHPSRHSGEGRNPGAGPGLPASPPAEEAPYRVLVGMRYAQPWIADALADLAAAGAERVVALVMSPQYSDVIMGGYVRAVDEACASLPRPVPTRVAGPWHTLPAFVDALAQRVREALDAIPASDRDGIPLLLTAHSLPKSVADREPGYMDQLRDTARLVAEAVGIPGDRWRFAYQSAGHARQEWLRPDLTELFPDLRRAGRRSVLVAPVQFLADHLELLYDIDVAAREQAEQAGLRLYRAAALNTTPGFIEALARVVQREEKIMSTAAVAS